MTTANAPSYEDILAARAAISGMAVRTPTLQPAALAEQLGTPIALKAENLQLTGSFKTRGVTTKLAQLADDCRQGVVTGSAGNHGQAMAYAAHKRGLSCELFVPRNAPVSKLEPAARVGAVITPCDGTVDDCVSAARERAAETGLAFIHPFDDPDVVAGQGTVGLELLEEVPNLTRVMIPLGGGGLASGVAIALKSQRPDIEVIGVQVDACAPYQRSLSTGEPVHVKARPTIADGIAVKRPGELTLSLVARWLDGVVVVDDDAIADAMALLLNEVKLIVEGAGAAGLAALLAGAAEPSNRGTTGIVLSGGNVDAQVLTAVVRRSEARSGRRVVISTTISDQPGSLNALLDQVARAGASVIDLTHIRDAVELHVDETGVELVLETRGREHTQELLQSLVAAGFVLDVKHLPERAVH